MTHMEIIRNLYKDKSTYIQKIKKESETMLSISSKDEAPELSLVPRTLEVTPS